MKETYQETEFPCEIPCAGCGEWVLIDVPGVDMNEIFPLHKVDEVLPFGKYKGKTIQEIYNTDPKYIEDSAVAVPSVAFYSVPL